MAREYTTKEGVSYTIPEYKHEIEALVDMFVESRSPIPDEVINAANEAYIREKSGGHVLQLQKYKDRVRAVLILNRP